MNHFKETNPVALNTFTRLYSYHLDLVTKYLDHSKMKPIRQLLPIPLFSVPGNHRSALFLRNYLLQIFHTNGMTQYVSFCRLSLNIRCLRFTHPEACQYFIPFQGCIIFPSVAESQLVHPFISSTATIQHLGCFHLSATVILPTSIALKVRNK